MTSEDDDEPRVPDEPEAHLEAGEGEHEKSDGPPADGASIRNDTVGNTEGETRPTRAADEVDQRIVDLLSWILDTETRAKIYIHLLANPGSTSEEVSRGTGLYPSTVREALAELHDEDRVSRQKRASGGAGNNPYEYTAIQPSELVGGVLDQVQRELNTIFTLDRLLDREETNGERVSEPVTIVVDDSNGVGGESNIRGETESEKQGSSYDNGRDQDGGELEGRDGDSSSGSSRNDRGRSDEGK